MTNLLKKSCLLAAALVLAGCHSKQAPAPQDNAPPVSNAAVKPAPAPAAPSAPQPASLDGDWKGDSGKDLPISFSVKNNQVSQLYISYRTQIGSCTSFASFGSDATATLNGKSFTVKGSRDQMQDHIEYTMTGNFTSDKDAAGTLHWVGKSNLCGPIDIQANWTAKMGAAEGSDSDADAKGNDND